MHTFPEGKVYQEDLPIRTLKWGTASLIARAPVAPIVLPIIHHGLQKVIIIFGHLVYLYMVVMNVSFHISIYIQNISFHSLIFQVMPEHYIFGRKPPLPLCGKDIKIVVGEPIEFDLPKLKQTALSMTRDSSNVGSTWPILKPCGLDEAAQRWLYTTISEQIRNVMERLRRNKI